MKMTEIIKKYENIKMKENERKKEIIMKIWKKWNNEEMKILIIISKKINNKYNENENNEENK